MYRIQMVQDFWPSWDICSVLVRPYIFQVGQHGDYKHQGYRSKLIFDVIFIDSWIDIWAFEFVKAFVKQIRVKTCRIPWKFYETEPRRPETCHFGDKPLGRGLVAILSLFGWWRTRILATPVCATAYIINSKEQSIDINILRIMLFLDILWTGLCPDCTMSQISISNGSSCVFTSYPLRSSLLDCREKHWSRSRFYCMAELGL